MKTGRNRPRRKDRTRVAALLLALAFLALATTPAQAGTGGLSAAAAGKAHAGQSAAFTQLRWAGATWYGPGLYGNRTACGQTLRPGTMGVAHRSLPCGTAVRFVHRGRQVVTRVIDRGPYSPGNAWDLTNGVRRILGFSGAGPIRYAVSLEYAKAKRAEAGGGSR